jgi:hypothetical protein
MTALTGADKQDFLSIVMRKAQPKNAAGGQHSRRRRARSLLLGFNDFLIVVVKN